jgi:hypothetical protein
MLIFGERELRIVLADCETLYNAHRPHRSLKQLPPIVDVDVGSGADGVVTPREILGALINDYRHAA